MPWTVGGPAGIGPWAWSGLLALLLLLGLWVRSRRRPSAGSAGPARAGDPEGEKSPEEPGSPNPQDASLLSPRERTAILPIESEDPLGVLTLLSLHHLFPEGFRQIVFVSAGIFDCKVLEAGSGGDGTFRGELEAERLRSSLRERLKRYVARAREFGWSAEYRISVGTNLADECERLCADLAREYPQALIFLGKLVFSQERWYHRIMHRRTADALRGRLERRGLTVTIIPVVVPG